MIFRILLALATSLVLLSSPAAAQSVSQAAAQIPEGSHLTLFALGAAGVLIGRRLSMRKHRDSDDD